MPQWLGKCELLDALSPDRGRLVSEPVYEHERPASLVELLRALAERIRELERDEDLLAAGPQLLKMMG